MSKVVGEICNYYGGLEVKEENGKYFWGIEDWHGTCYQEIPEYLYNALIRYEEERENETH